MYFVSSGLCLIVWLVIDCCGLGLIVLVRLFLLVVFIVWCCFVLCLLWYLLLSLAVCVLVCSLLCLMLLRCDYGW